MGDRNRALIVVLWRGGLRTGEVLGLRVSDLDPARGLIQVSGEVAKGGKPRMVGLDPEAFAVLNVWASQRQALGITGRAPLLYTLSGSPVDAGYCRTMLKRAAKRAGIQTRVHLHGLRHSHAVELGGRMRGSRATERCRVRLASSGD